jgi:hypothetical protein
MSTQEGVTPQADQLSKDHIEVHTPVEVTEMFRWLKDNVVTHGELQDELGKIRSEMATKEDLKQIRQDLRKTEQELRDHTTRECAKIRDIFFDVAHRQNEKTNEFVRVAQKSGTISHADGMRLITINPFTPQSAE